MRRHWSYILTIMICLILIVILIVHISQQSDNISSLQNQKEQIEKDYKRLQSDYVELSQQIEKCKIANEELTKQLAMQKRIVPDGWQPFYGWWVAGIYYKADLEDGKECWKEIIIHHNYIKIIDDRLTDEPIFDIAVRIRSDVIEEIKSIGVEDENLINMLQAECYAEMDFSSIYNWNRELFPEEVDLIENAKYYIIDNQTMLCISKNNGGRVYVLNRFAY